MPSVASTTHVADPLIDDSPLASGQLRTGPYGLDVIPLAVTALDRHGELPAE